MRPTRVRPRQALDGASVFGGSQNILLFGEFGQINTSFGEEKRFQWVHLSGHQVLGLASKFGGGT